MNEPRSDRRVVVITGGSDGIGAAAARLLARRGDRVVLVGRSPGKTRSAAAQIGAEGHIADFAHLGQVRELAAALVRQHPRIDVLVNNAGLIAGAQRTVTADGHELTFQVNHLAPFLLTLPLRDPLAAARASVITTSSQAGTVRSARVDPGDLDMTTGYNGLRAYQSSKLANVLFTRELARRREPSGSAPPRCTQEWSDHDGADQDRQPSGQSSTHPCGLPCAHPNAARTRSCGWRPPRRAKTGKAAGTSPTAGQPRQARSPATRNWPNSSGTGRCR